MIEFRGIRSDERYLIIEHYPQRIIPKQRYTTQTVPGRSGTLYIPEGYDVFENYQQNYSAFLDAKAPGLPMVARGLAEWLLGKPGYQRLEDSYDPDFYRLAIYTGNSQFANFFNEYGRGTLTFDCIAKRFYKIGEVPVDVTDGAWLYSPSTFGSKPLVTIYGSGNCGITVNGRKLLVKDVTDYVIIDTELHTAVDHNNANVNAKVGSGDPTEDDSDYEHLYLDSISEIGFYGGTTGAKIIPRWWTL